MARTATAASKTNSYKRDSLSEKAAFEEIVRIAMAHTDYDTSSRPQMGSGAKNDIGCQIKALPVRLRAKASAHAIRVNPANRPALENLVLPPGVSHPLFLTLATSKYWGVEPREFTVSFLQDASEDIRTQILEHMNAWADRINKTFVETSDVGEVRISFGPGGYYSYLGTDVSLIPEDQQTMNLEGFHLGMPESEYRRVVRHETGHTLGFEHEHMRAELVSRIDPEKAYPYFWETQGWDQQMVDQQVLTPLNEDDITGTDPDQDSIMCYQITGEITYDGQPIRGGLDINETDYEFAASLYPQTVSSTRKRPGKTSAKAAYDWGPAKDVKLRY